MNKDFERWIHSVKAKGIMIDGHEVPLITGLLYRVCGGSGAKFEELIEALELAFEAGRDTGDAMPLILADWMPIDTAPKDHPILVYAPGREGLPGIISVCQWHEDAGFCVDELREPTIWTSLPAVPDDLQ